MVFVLQGKRRIPSNGEVAFIAFMENLKEMEAEPRPENEDRFLNSSRYPTVRAVYQDFFFFFFFFFLEKFARHIC